MIWVGKVRGRRSGMQRASRVAHELFVGDVADNLQIDHLCRIPLCVNPDHLEAGTARENTRRAVAAGSFQKREEGRTHCKRGHKYTAENLRHDVRLHRPCSGERRRTLNHDWRRTQSMAESR